MAPRRFSDGRVLEMDSRRRRKLSGVMVALMAERPGKTDTACILYEALHYIGFLHGQVQAVVEKLSDLRSRGLCLVPICCSDRVAGVDVCSLVAAMELAAEEEAPPWMLRLRGDHHPGQPV
nr:transcription factor bHLH153-like [Aegilops tauschii subsp. strangulata]